MSQEKGPLERQNNEGNEAFAAFNLYRELGLTRTVKQVAEQLNKSHQLLYRWKQQHHWDERLAEYDRELAEESKKAAIAKYRKFYAEAVETRIKVANSLKLAALKSLNGINENNQISVEDALTLLDKASAIESAVFKEMLGINSTGAVQIEGDTVTNNLLEAILAGTREEIDISDIPELEQETDDCDDMVESSELDE